MVVLPAYFWYLLLQMLHFEVPYFSSFSNCCWHPSPPHPPPPPVKCWKVWVELLSFLYVCGSHLDTVGMRTLFWNAVIVLVYIKSTFTQLYQRHSGLAYWYMACVCMQIRYCSACAHMFVNVRVWCVHVCAYALILVCVYECASDPFCLECGLSIENIYIYIYT